jgi:hypothetical protein
MLQAFRLELRYAAMKRKQQHDKEKAEEKKNAADEGSNTTPSNKEAQVMLGQIDGQQQGTEEVSDQVCDRVKKTGRSIS